MSQRFLVLGLGFQKTKSYLMQSDLYMSLTDSLDLANQMATKIKWWFNNW
jgi:hypothetical protein